MLIENKDNKQIVPTINGFQESQLFLHSQFLASCLLQENSLEFRVSRFLANKLFLSLKQILESLQKNCSEGLVLDAMVIRILNRSQKSA